MPVGDVTLGTVFDVTGAPVHAGLTARLVSMRPDDLRLITHVVALSHGRARAAAVAAGIRGGYLTSIVVDTPLAHELLAQHTEAADD